MKIEASVTYPNRVPFDEVVAAGRKEFPDRVVSVVRVNTRFHEIHDGVGNLVDISEPEWTYTLELT